jgi:hypothetical protein
MSYQVVRLRIVFSWKYVGIFISGTLYSTMTIRVVGGVRLNARNGPTRQGLEFSTDPLGIGMDLGFLLLLCSSDINVPFTAQIIYPQRDYATTHMSLE